MTWIFKLLSFTFGGILVCMVAYITVYTSLVFLAVHQLPSWAQTPVLQWMLSNTANMAGQHSDLGQLSVQIPLDGYVGPESFRCILPPEIGYITDYFGVSRPGGWTHYGIDYGTYYQSVKVRTPFGGKVVFADWNGPYGNLLVIENAGVQIYLAHNESLNTHPGQVVTAGEIVALSGNTGNSSGYHVHFEVRAWTGESWAAVDPNRIVLPGQNEVCDWNLLSSAAD